MEAAPQDTSHWSGGGVLPKSRKEALRFCSVFLLRSLGLGVRAVYAGSRWAACPCSRVFRLLSPPSSRTVGNVRLFRYRIRAGRRRGQLGRATTRPSTRGRGLTRFLVTAPPSGLMRRSSRDPQRGAAVPAFPIPRSSGT